MKPSDYLKKKGNLIQNKYGQWIFFSKKVEFENTTNEDEIALDELDNRFIDIKDNRAFKNKGYIPIGKLKDRLRSLYKLVDKHEKKEMK